MKLETFFEKFDQFADAPDAVARLRDVVYSVELAAEKWPHESLESVALKVTDGTHQTPRYVETGIPFVSVKDFSGGSLDMSATRFITSEEHGEIYKRCDPKRGDILLGRIGTIGKAVVVDTDIEFSLFVSAAQIRPDRGKILSRYLQYVLNSPFCRAQFDNIKVGGATHTNKLNLKDLRSVRIPLPPLAEQKRIVAKVDELMTLCDRLEAQQQERETRHAALARASLARFADAPTPANLHFLFHPSYAISPADLRKSILTLAVQGKLVPQDPNDEPAEELIARIARELTQEQRRKQAAPLPPLPAESLQYEIPESWTWARFRDAAIIASNLVKPDEFLDFTHLAPDNIEKGNGMLLPCRTVREDKVISSNHRFYPGQIVYSKIRPNLAKVVVVDFEGLCSADMYPIDALIDAFYLQLYMLSESFLVQAVKTDTRVAMPKINQTELNAIAVPIPPLAEQRRIVAKVEQLMALVDALETQLAASRATAENLLAAVVAELTEGTHASPAC
jgi:type I restriction enzyme S subunit